MEGPSGYAMPRIQVDIWGRDYAEAQNVGEKVRNALSGFRGTIAGVTVQGIIDLDDHDVVDEDEEVLVTEQRHLYGFSRTPQRVIFRRKSCQQQ